MMKLHEPTVHATLATVVEYLARKRCGLPTRGIATHVGISVADVETIISSATRHGLLNKNGNLVREVKGGHEQSHTNQSYEG